MQLDLIRGFQIHLTHVWGTVSGTVRQGQEACKGRARSGQGAKGGCQAGTADKANEDTHKDCLPGGCAQQAGRAQHACFNSLACPTHDSINKQRGLLMQLFCGSKHKEIAAANPGASFGALASLLSAA